MDTRWTSRNYDIRPRNKEILMVLAECDLAVTWYISFLHHNCYMYEIVRVQYTVYMALFDLGCSVFRQSRCIFWNHTLKQYTSIESLCNLLLRDTFFPHRINIKVGQISPKIVIIFMAKFRKARRFCDVMALSHGLKCSIRKFALERAFLNQNIKCSPRVHWPLRLRAPWRPNSTWHFAHILRELSPAHSKSHNLNFL